MKDIVNSGLVMVRPEDSQILRIYYRSRQHDFLYGYCRGLLHIGPYIQFVDGFRHVGNPNMTAHWAEPTDFGMQRLEQFVFDTTREVRWMTLSGPRNL